MSMNRLDEWKMDDKDYFSDLSNRIQNGTAGNMEAYYHAVTMLAHSGSKFLNSDFKNVESLSRKEAEKSACEIQKAIDMTLDVSILFDKYPVAKLLAESMRDALSYAYACIVPILCHRNVDAKNSNRKLVKTYVLRNPATGLIKIGKTCNLKTRLQALECGAGVELSLVAYIQGDVERDLHVLFSDSRVKGEWFSDESGKIEMVAKKLEKEIRSKPSSK